MLSNKQKTKTNKNDLEPVEDEEINLVNDGEINNELSDDEDDKNIKKDKLDDDEDEDNDEIEDDDDVNDALTEIEMNNIVEEIFVEPNDRITSNIITEFEFSKIIGIRATQIQDGSKIYVDIGNLTNPIEIARKEIFNNKCPLSIKRFIGIYDNKKLFEVWNVNELTKR